MDNSANVKLRPVFMVYPGLFALYMMNYWAYEAKVPIAGIMISGFDIKIKGKASFAVKESKKIIKGTAWQYFFYMLFVAKFSVKLVGIFNFCKRIVRHPVKIKSFRKIASDKNIPIFYTKDFNNDQALGFIKDIEANIAVSAYNNQILSTRVLNSCKFKAINVHDGYLPDFKGIDAPFEYLYNGLSEAGATIHFVDEGTDTGDIIAQKQICINEQESLFSLSKRLWMLGAYMLPEVLKQFEENIVSSFKQDIGKVKYPYRSYPSKRRLKEFLKNGGSFMKFKEFINVLFC